MKKLLFVASTEVHIRHFHLPYLEKFRELGWEVDVACGNCPDAIPGADRVIPLPFEKRMASWKNLQAARILRREIRSRGYDRMICHTSLAAFFARLAVMGLKKRPLVCNMVHGYLFDDQSSFGKRLVLSAAERITAPVTDRILTMNRYDTAYAREKRLARRVDEVKGIGLNGRKESLTREALAELGIGEGSFVLLYAAEFSGRKSQAVLIRALPLLPASVVLLLPGDGVLLEECKALAEKLGVADRTFFPGYVRGAGKWYSVVDAAVSSSRSEGLPFNIMEAMFCGLPIVASDVKGNRDLLEHGVSGLLYPYGDSTAFAQMVLRLLQEPELASRLACEAERRVQDYRLETVLPAVMELYLS